jgi:hypothetical protein
MGEQTEREQERSRRLDRLIRSLEADNQRDAERSAELLEALAPFASVTIPDHVREAFDEHFAAEAPAPQATTRTAPATTAAFIRA